MYARVSMSIIGSVSKSYQMHKWRHNKCSPVDSLAIIHCIYCCTAIKTIRMCNWIERHFVSVEQEFICLQSTLVFQMSRRAWKIFSDRFSGRWKIFLFWGSKGTKIAPNISFLLVCKFDETLFFSKHSNAKWVHRISSKFLAKSQICECKTLFMEFFHGFLMSPIGA